MNYKEKVEEFNKRWSIIDNLSYEEEFKKFKKRVLNIFSDIDRHIEKEGIRKFCQILGTTEEWKSNYNTRWSENIINSLKNENNEKQFYRLLHIIFLLPIKTSYSDYSREVTYSRVKLFKDLYEAIELSNINLSITAKNEEVILYPRGEKEFDTKLVNKVLSFLNPESEIHFVDALNSYSNFSSKNAIKSSESLRRALEEFLRFKLNNNKGLQQNIVELGKKLKASSCDSVIRNNITQTFSLMDLYFNENSKHNDGEIDENENEFLIYQTGILMRYISKIPIAE